MEIQLKITGIQLLLLALMHIAFPGYFNWKKELQSLNLINRQMMQVHTFFIALTVLLMGLLCYGLPAELLHTKLGKYIGLGFGIFWGIRLFIQFFVYSPKLWKGKTKETIIHILFAILWGYFTCIFLSVYFK
jgi:hypothetical protein